MAALIAVLIMIFDIWDVTNVRAHRRQQHSDVAAQATSSLLDHPSVNTITYPLRKFTRQLLSAVKKKSKNAKNKNKKKPLKKNQHQQEEEHKEAYKKQIQTNQETQREYQKNWKQQKTVSN